MNGEKKKILTAIVIIVIIAILSLAGIFLINNAFNDTPDNEESDFGDEGIDASLSADAKLLTPLGEDESVGLYPVSLSPELLFSSCFETGDLSDWDVSSTNVFASTMNVYQGGYSGRFAPSCASEEYLQKDDAIDIQTDDSIILNFSVYFDGSFQTGSQTTPPLDYFVVKLKFDSDKTLVYLLGGLYAGKSQEAVIDVRHLLNETCGWAFIHLDGIENDYRTQFGDEMPHKADLEFRCHTVWGGEVFIDCVRLYAIPESKIVSHWEHEGTEVESFYIDGIYKVDITDEVNESSVTMEIKIWMTITSENGTMVEEELIQDAIIVVDEFGEDVNWTSKTFALPKDNLAYGSNLNYTFDLYASVCGRVGNGSYWVEDHILMKGFDSFEISWFSEEVAVGSWIIIILGSAGGFGVLGIALYRRKKKKEIIDFCGCDPKDESCDCDF